MTDILASRTVSRRGLFRGAGAIAGGMALAAAGAGGLGGGVLGAPQRAFAAGLTGKSLVPSEGIEPSSPVCKTSVFPLERTGHIKFWSAVRESNSHYSVIGRA